MLKLNLSYKINIKSIMARLILIVIILTPLFSIMESIGLILGGIVGNGTALTSPYIKGIKDLVFILLILLSLGDVIKKERIGKKLFIFLSIIIPCILVPAFFYMKILLIFLSGIRWIIPFILAFFLIEKIDEKLLKQISIILFGLFILHFSMQIVQLFFAQGYFGTNSLGLSVRNPGIFFMPSTSASFTILVLFFCKFYMSEKLKKKIILLIPISIFLTASGSGIGILMIIVVIYYLKKRYLKLIPFILFVMAFVLVFSLNFLTGRDDLMEESFGTRIDILLDVILSGSLLPQKFGYGTSTGYLIADKYNLEFDMVSTESWYATVIVNLGLINSLFIFLFITKVFFILLKKKDKEKLIFFIIYALFSATTTFTESFPVNILFSVLVGYYLAPLKSNFDKKISTGKLNRGTI